MADGIVSPQAVPATGLPGLIADALPARARKAVNAFVVGNAVFHVGKNLHARWLEHTSYAITLHGDDDLYDDMMVWLLAQMPPNRRRSLEASLDRRTTSPVSDTVEVSPSPDTRRVDPVVPLVRLAYDGSVAQRVVIDGHRIRVTTETPEPSFHGGGRLSEYEAYYRAKNKLTLHCQSVAAQQAVLRLLDRLAAARGDSPEPPRLWVASSWGHWERRAHLQPRPASTVILDDGVVDGLFTDIEQFLDAEAQYELLGLPWHRGYLFEGPPGAGKSSIAQAIATHFGLDMYWVSISSLENDSALIRLMNDVRARSVVLLEDIDVLRASHDRDEDDPPTEGTTLTGLLNVLDGMLAPHGMIAVMTTNHVERLDPALIRAGRFDYPPGQIKPGLHIGPLRGAALNRLIEMLTGRPVAEMHPRFEAIPSDVVGIVKAHMHDQAAAHRAVTAWIQERTRTWS